MQEQPHLYWTPRSGGTFVWQVLSRCISLDEEKRRDGHAFIENLSCPIIINYRDPRDIAVSYLRITQGKYDDNQELIYIPPTEHDIKKHIIGVKSNFQILNQYKEVYGHRSDVLWLKYEDYIDDINILLDKIEAFMDIKIDTDKRSEIARETGRRKNIEISKKVKHWRDDASCDFDHYDIESKIHKYHIYNGEYAGWRNYIPKEYHKMLNLELSDELTKWEYQIEI